MIKKKDDAPHVTIDRNRAYRYYDAKFKLITPMLGTSTEVSIWKEHVIEKARKEIAKANRLGDKINKSLDKYKGSEITDAKETMELQSIMRAFLQLLGKSLEVPNTVEELLEFNSQLREEFEEEIKKRSELKATVFMKDKDGWPIISTHMILGNLKENLRISVNNGDKSVLSTKVSIGEVMALDVKPVDLFMRPSKDILRVTCEEELQNLPLPGAGRYMIDIQDGAKGPMRVILERPIQFERMGKKETAIAMSEVLPEDTEFGTILRVRNSSPMTQDNLSWLFNFGKNNGMGSWRGSGHMGAYKYQLNDIDYHEPEDGDWK